MSLHRYLDETSVPSSINQNPGAVTVSLQGNNPAIDTRQIQRCPERLSLCKGPPPKEDSNPHLDYQSGVKHDLAVLAWFNVP